MIAESFPLGSLDETEGFPWVGIDVRDRQEVEQ